MTEPGRITQHPTLFPAATVSSMIDRWSQKAASTAAPGLKAFPEAVPGAGMGVWWAKSDASTSSSDEPPYLAGSYSRWLGILGHAVEAALASGRRRATGDLV